MPRRPGAQRTANLAWRVQRGERRVPRHRKVRSGPIDRQRAADPLQTTRHGGPAGSQRHFADGHRSQRRVRGRLDPARVNASIDETVAGIYQEVVVDAASVENASGLGFSQAMPMPVAIAEMPVRNERETRPRQTETKINPHPQAAERPADAGGEAGAWRQGRPTTVVSPVSPANPGRSPNPVRTPQPAVPWILAPAAIRRAIGCWRCSFFIIATVRIPPAVPG